MKWSTSPKRRGVVGILIKRASESKQGVALSRDEKQIKLT